MSTANAVVIRVHRQPGCAGGLFPETFAGLPIPEKVWADVQIA